MSSLEGLWGEVAETPRTITIEERRGPSLPA
jgi:hypothetical protein